MVFKRTIGKPFFKQSSILIPKEPSRNLIVPQSVLKNKIPLVKKRLRNPFLTHSPQNNTYFLFIFSFPKKKKPLESNAAKWWQSQYEDPKIIEIVDKLWTDIKPLYTELHTYVKRKLLNIYSDKNAIDGFDSKSETIPAHLLGAIHANSWSNLYEDTKPHKDKFTINYTDIKSNKAMFDWTNTIYTSIGLNPLQFDKSILDAPENGKIMCEPDAFDFGDGTDYRTKMCPTIIFHDFTIIHNILGHVQYFTQYKNMSLILRHEAYPGFYQAIGGVTSLAMTSPHAMNHVKSFYYFVFNVVQIVNCYYTFIFTQLRILSNYENTDDENLNSLYLRALEYIPSLPYALLVDKWRWEVFEDATKDDLNKNWWNLHKDYMKLSTPNDRGSKAFDATANHHVVADKQYLK